jgi:hypothetical protein
MLKKKRIDLAKNKILKGSVRRERNKFGNLGIRDFKLDAM